MPDTTVHATPLLLIFFYNRFFMPLFFDAFEVNHSLHFGYSTCAVLPSGQNNAAKHGTANYYHHRQGEKNSSRHITPSQSYGRATQNTPLAAIMASSKQALPYLAINRNWEQQKKSIRLNR